MYVHFPQKFSDQFKGSNSITPERQELENFLEHLVNGLCIGHCCLSSGRELSDQHLWYSGASVAAATIRNYDVGIILKWKQ